ncbi:MAG TPA: apolipoprotein N-acyltransferase [Caulobacteraceae bacterium]
MAEAPVAPSRPWLFRALAVVAGVGAALAHPPWGVLPGLCGYALMFLVVDRAALGRPLRSAFFRGWLAGGAYFTISLWWLAEPFYIDAQEQGWMAPFAVVIVALGMALFWGAAAWAYRLLGGRSVARVMLFAAALGGFEWLRGHILTGFPWDLPGESWRAGSAPSQAAAFVGAYGLTWLTVGAFTTLAVVLEGWRGRAALAVGMAVVLGLYGVGWVRLAGAIPPGPDAPWVRIVQADVKQESKYDQSLFASIVSRYLVLTARPSAHPPDIVVWPEGAIPQALDDYLAPGALTREAIVGVMRPGETLLVGGYRYGHASDGRSVVYNSLWALRRTADDLAVIGVYDKFRLVPFGEFMPLDGLASALGIKQFVHVGDGFAPGPKPRPMRLPGLAPVQPLICYESLFPGFTRDGARAAGIRPTWIANVSNDAWFGTGSGPVQHLNMASYRAIEEGLPMARATPTGRSAMIDAFGRIVPGKALGEGALGVIDAPLPAALPPTLFDRLGDGAFFAMLIVSLVGARGISRRHGRGPPAPSHLRTDEVPRDQAPPGRPDLDTAAVDRHAGASVRPEDPGAGRA